MLTRKTQYAWMAMGGLICLFGLVLACKLRDGSKAIAQDEKSSTPLPPLVEPPVPSPIKEPPPPLPLLAGEAEAKKPLVSDKNKDVPKKGTSAPKATLGMPMLPPPAAPSAPISALPDEKKPMTGSGPAPLPPPGGVLPVSFGANTPTAKAEKKDDKKKEDKKDLPSPAGQPFGGDPKDLSAADKTKNTRPAAPTWDKPTDAPPLPKPVFGSGLKAKPEDKPAEKKPTPPPALGSDLSSKPLPPSATEVKVTPTSFAPVSAAPPSTGAEPPDHDAKTQPNEPPLAPAPGPVQTYHVHGSETLQEIARRTLGSSERVSELHRLNPMLKTDAPLSAGTVVRLPGDACVQSDDTEPIKPLPALRARPTPPKARVLPLTGTYQCSLDEKGQLTLPRALRDQFGGSETVLLSPGPDKCLWLTNQPHLERLGERLEQSQANEADVRVFKRLYFAQTEKLPVSGEGRVAIPERLAQFAGLHQEVVLVGIDDHFEVWDAARWRQYTQQKSGAGRSVPATEE